MGVNEPGGRYDPFLQRLKAYFTRSRMTCTEEKMGGTTVIYVSRNRRAVSLPPSPGEREGRSLLSPYPCAMMRRETKGKEKP